MARLLQNSFNCGELSPLLHGRSDLAAYYRGCADAKNFVVTKEGALRKRNGIVAGEALPAAFDRCRVVAYRHDRTVGAAVVLWDRGADAADGMRVGVRLYDKSLAMRAETAFAADGPCDVRAARSTQIGDQLWITNGAFFKVVTVACDESAGTFSLAVGDWTPAAKPAKPAYFSCTGYNEKGNEYDGSGETSIGYCAVLVVDGVASDRSTGSAYQKKSWVAGAYVTISVSLSAEQLKAGFDYVAVGKSQGGTYGEIARFYPEDYDAKSLSSGRKTCSYTDRNVSPGDVIYRQTDVLGDGFAAPLCVDCFQQRRVFANAESDGSRWPMTLWFSEAGNLANFHANRPAADDDAFSPTIASTGPAFIRWVAPWQEMLVLFTDCGLFSVGFSQTQGFGASSCRVSKFSGIVPSPDVRPVSTDAGLVFVSADGRRVYTVGFDLQENSLKPVDRSVMVEHLTRDETVVALALQESPDSVVWCATSAGRLLSFTFERGEEVYAWSHSELTDGGRVLDAVSLGTFTDAASGRSRGDVVFVVDWPGMEEEGENPRLAAFSDGHEDRADPLCSAPADVEASLTTLRPESQDRTLAGVRRNVKDVLVRLHRTAGVSLRPADGSPDVPFVDAGAGGARDADGLFTGDAKAAPRGLAGQDGRISVVSPSGPCELLAVLATLEVGG